MHFLEAPDVVFVQVESADVQERREIPLHPHIYTNGIICLDLLDPQGMSCIIMLRLVSNKVVPIDQVAFWLRVVRLCRFIYKSQSYVARSQDRI